MRTESIAVATLTFAACGGTGENIDKEACTYLEAGTSAAITAGATMDATAPAIEAAKQSVEITLPATGPGFLSFNSTDDTEYAVIMDRDIAVIAFTTTGTEIAPQAMSTSSAACAKIKGRHIIELPVAQFYFRLGPDSGGPFALVLRPYSPD